MLFWRERLVSIMIECTPVLIELILSNVPLSFVRKTDHDVLHAISNYTARLVNNPKE